MCSPRSWAARWGDMAPTRSIVRTAPPFEKRSRNGQLELHGLKRQLTQSDEGEKVENAKQLCIQLITECSSLSLHSRSRTPGCCPLLFMKSSLWPLKQRSDPASEAHRGYDNLLAAIKRAISELHTTWCEHASPSEYPGGRPSLTSRSV